MWTRASTGDRIGFAIAALLSIMWLVRIIVDHSWWELAIWVIVLPVGVGGWLARGYFAEKIEKAQDDSVG